jgi:hypothetical protein
MSEFRRPIVELCRQRWIYTGARIPCRRVNGAEWSPFRWAASDAAVSRGGSLRHECTALLQIGCRELCCVGPEAEALHDELDQIVEAEDALDVTTTWHTELLDACEYFVWAAGGARSPLVAVVSDHTLATLLFEELEEQHERSGRPDA